MRIMFASGKEPQDAGKAYMQLVTYMTVSHKGERQFRDGIISVFDPHGFGDALIVR